MKEKKFFWALFVSLAAILWWLDGIVLTPRLYNLDINFVVFMLHIIPFVMMSILFSSQFSYFKKFSRKDILTFFAIALFGWVLGTLSIVKALFLVQFDGLSVVVLLQKFQPVFAITFAAIFLKEKVSKNFFTYASLAVVGSYFLIFWLHLPSFSLTSNYLEAIMFSLLAAFSFGSATVLWRHIIQKYDFKTTTFYRFGFTAFLMFFIVLINGKFWEISNVTPLNWIVFFTIAVTTWSGALLLYYFGLKKIEAKVATLCELFFPISSVFFDFVINGKVLSVVQILGAIVIIYSVININKE